MRQKGSEPRPRSLPLVAPDPHTTQLLGESGLQHTSDTWGSHGNSKEKQPSTWVKQDAEKWVRGGAFNGLTTPGRPFPEESGRTERVAQEKDSGRDSGQIPAAATVNPWSLL